MNDRELLKQAGHYFDPDRQDRTNAALAAMQAARADERERCAKVCEERVARCVRACAEHECDEGPCALCEAESACAAAIRALGQRKEAE